MQYPRRAGLLPSIVDIVRNVDVSRSVRRCGAGLAWHGRLSTSGYSSRSGERVNRVNATEAVNTTINLGIVDANAVWLNEQSTRHQEEA